MLTSHTSSEEEKILYLRFRKFAQNIRNYNEVLSCLKIPLTSMRFTASSENSRPRQFFPSLPIPPPLNPLEETLLQSVLRSFITVFIVTRLENKLTRAPLLGLAKSIY